MGGTDPRTKSPAGLWISLVVIGTGLLVVFTISSSCGRDRDAMCMNNLYQIFTAMGQYRDDWDGALSIPQSKAQRVSHNQSWRGMMGAYLPDNFNWRCSRLSDRMAYSINRELIGAEFPISKWRDENGKMHTTIAGPQPDTVIAFETVNDDPRNNNLNGDTICHPTVDNLPVTGSYVIWPRGGYWFYRNWPDWARPRHGRMMPVLYMDGHVERNAEPTFSPK